MLPIINEKTSLPAESSEEEIKGTFPPASDDDSKASSVEKHKAARISDYSVLSEAVEIEQPTEHDGERTKRHKAILKFLGLPEGESATWRVKEARDVSDLNEMTLEEQGDFLINKIALDFCNWMRELGGEMNISEEIVKELFQIGMENPASKAICIKMREKRVHYYKLAEFLEVPAKSFHEVLSLHLNWDVKTEKKLPVTKAFGRGLPKDMKFKVPKNKTAQTWLELNKLSTHKLSFADVYKAIKELRSTKEYCKWLLNHPEFKKPQFLVEQKMFERNLIGRHSKGSLSILGGRLSDM